MPGWMTTAWNVGWQIGQWLAGGASQLGKAASAANALRDLLRNLQQVVALLAWGDEAEQQAWSHSMGYWLNGASQFKQAFSEVNISLRHIVDTILPNSLHHVYGKVGAQAVAPLRHELRADEKRYDVAAIQAADADHWVMRVGAPGIADWKNWSTWFTRNALNPVLTLIDWIRHPANFGEWAAPPLVGPLITYWAASGHQNSRDNLTRVILDGALETRQTSEDTVLALLQSTYP